MRDETHHPAEGSPDSEPASLAAVHPLKAAPDVKTARRTLKILKNCGDCEPGGFGSTHGFGPR